MAQELFSIIIIFTLTFILGEICKLLKISKLLGYLSSGILISYSMLKDYVINPETFNTLNSLSDLGIILLFFFVGLNINLREFKFNIRESSSVSFFSSLIPIALGFLVSKYFLNLDVITSLTIGVALSATSQIISVNLLEELNIMKTKIGNLIITSGAANDVFELILVSGILAVISLGKSFQGIYTALANVSIFIVAVILLRFILFPYILHFFESSKSETSLFSGAILIAMLTALLSNLLGLGTFVGALFSGVVIRQILLTGKKKRVWEEHNISKSIHTVAFGFLVPIFFVVAGLRTDLNLIFNNISLTLIFLLIALAGTIGGSILGAISSKNSFKEGLITGFGINSRGDIELVIATIALNAGLFTLDIFSAIVIMAFITTLITPLIFRHLVKKNYTLLNLRH